MAAAEPLRDAAEEVRRHQRFAFGGNWAAFLRVVNEERISAAESSLREMLEVSDLTGRSFLDIGCGSGLFSLAARRLGARVSSFDYDPASVACAHELRRRFFPDDTDWRIEQGSVLDGTFMQSIGTYDIVYSWGVLHHTGALWRAMANAFGAVAPSGRIWLALYNHQPLLTPWWRAVKRAYLVVPEFVRPLYVLPFYGYVLLAGLAADLVCGIDPRVRFSGRGRRGMDVWRDVVDWVGGWPFETATPQEVVDFARPYQLTLCRLRTVGGRHGCNEYVLTRPETAR
jgi:2-polyprenyl-3-methyl-5-hydroxy-6-metoxy-1,4-benzoquinol methylase